jgi:7-dehydrocholesterol reductase
MSNDHPPPDERRTWAGRSETPLGEFVRMTLGPLALMLVTPPAAIAFFIACAHLDGEVSRLFSREGLDAIVTHFPRPSLVATQIIVAFVVFEALLLKALPGAEFFGPITPAGNRPRYTLNGVAAFFVTLATFAGASYGAGLFPASIVFDHFGEVLITLNASALVFCGFLYFKGRFAPSSTDWGLSGNPIFDFYWGVELFPTLFGISLKQLFNCRIGMMGWAVTIVSFAAAQHAGGHLSTAMAVSVLLQLVYIFKFFVWEGGYFASLDVMHDRFGYYICWGVSVWIPALYTLPTQWLVRHPIDLHPLVAIAIVLFGVASIWANYDADAQRQRVRETKGKTTVWGRKPSIIYAEYTTADGEKHQSILLVSGWWSLARHAHYVPELGLAAAWTLPAGFTHLTPWIYWLFLTALLMDRASRDDARCRTKYGAFWDEYCERVPYKVIPGLY